jgi:hypothetical protein
MTKEAYREVAETDYWAFRHSDYLMECTQLGEPSLSRTPAVSLEEREAARTLTGVAITLLVRGASDQPAEQGHWVTHGTILQVSGDEPPYQKALLHLKMPLIYGGTSYQYAVAYLRYDGEGIARLPTTGVFLCSLKGLPATQAVSAPFDRRSWPSGAPLAGELHRG